MSRRSHHRSHHRYSYDYEDGQVNGQTKTRSCCTWPKLILAVAGMIAGGIALWKIAPIESAIDNILPTFNNTGVLGGGSDGSSVGEPMGEPTVAPTLSADEERPWNRCSWTEDKDCCNGLEGDFCDLPVNEALFAMNHNANSDWETGFWLAPNHRYKLEDSLVAGYRGINLDVCNCGGELVLCHGVCNISNRDVIEVARGIHDFLDQNPSDTLVIALELNSEAGLPVDLQAFYQLLVDEVPALVAQFYQHPGPESEWPTFQQLKDNQTRIIVFHYRGPSCDEASPCPPGMHWYHQYVVNTQWQVPDLEMALNYPDSCAFARAPGPDSLTFFGLNNFVVPADQSTAKMMNSYDFLVERTEACSTLNGGLGVNFIYADFWSEGDLPRLVQDENEARVERRRLAAP